MNLDVARKVVGNGRTTCSSLILRSVVASFFYQDFYFDNNTIRFSSKKNGLYEWATERCLVFSTSTILRQHPRYYALPSSLLFILREKLPTFRSIWIPAFDPLPFLLFVLKFPVEISFLNYSATSNCSFESSPPIFPFPRKFRQEDVIWGMQFWKIVISIRVYESGGNYERNNKSTLLKSTKGRLKNDSVRVEVIPL